MKKKILFAIFAFATAVLATAGTSLLTQKASAANVCDAGTAFWSITRWCEGLPENPDFTKGREEIAKYVLILVANIYGMITDVASYVAVILVMWGGFLYVTSSGDPGKSMKGQKTITNSLIGIVIVKGSDIIFKLIKTIATGAKSTANVGGTAGVAPLASYVGGRALFWGGIIAVIMIIWGALQYSMSAGDPGKATKGKKTIISACIGIAIMMFAAIIVTIVINTLGVNND